MFTKSEPRDSYENNSYVKKSVYDEEYDLNPKYLERGVVLNPTRKFSSCQKMVTTISFPEYIFYAHFGQKNINPLDVARTQFLAEIQAAGQNEPPVPQ